jgi:hypothetical protein
MVEILGQESTSKPDVTTDTEEESGLSAKQQERYEEFNDLIGCILKLDPKKYAQPWTDEMLMSMRALLTKSVNSFPKKSRPMLELFRKFLFDNGQLIAMAATAHAVAAQHAEKEESLIVRPSFEDLAKAELNKNE